MTGEDSLSSLLTNWQTGSWVETNIALLVCIDKVLLKSAKIGESQPEFIPVACLIQFEEAFNLAA